MQSEGSGRNVGQGDVVVGNINPAIVHALNAVGVGDRYILVEVESCKLNGEAAFVG